MRRTLIVAAGLLGALSALAQPTPPEATEDPAAPGWAEAAPPPTPRVGAWLEAPPPIPPGGLLHAPPASLQAGIRHHLEGDSKRAVIELEAWLESGEGPWGRERDAGRFLLGWLYMQQGHHNLASAEFTAVRSGGGPLDVYATFYEALTDHRRGRHPVAARECAAYRERFPDGPHADECLVLMGDAYVAAGLRTPAIEAYLEYLERNPGTPREEELRLGIALAEVNGNPSKGARLLAELALSHDAHCNGEAAQRALDALLASGAAEDPEMDPLLVEQLQAITLRECGYTDEAWERFVHLSQEHGEDAEAWIAQNRDRFAWRTQQYELLGQSFAASYKADPDGESAWYAFRAYFRGGLWQEAAEWGELGMDKYGSYYRFRGARDQVAHANQLAGRYTRAREHWDVLGKTGGSLGRSARWFGAYASVRAKDWDEAIARLSAVMESDSESALAARYYRGKAKEGKGDRQGAAADWNHIRSNEPDSWYALLLEGRWRELTDPPDPVRVRQGRWDGPPPPASPEAPPPLPVAAPPLARPGVRGELAEALTPASRPAWTPTPVPLPAPPAEGQPEAAQAPGLEPAPATEPSYAPGRFYDPETARRGFYAFAEAHKDLWPLLPALYDLASVGLYEITGPAVSEIYEEWVDARRRRTARERDLRAEVQLDRTAWRNVFLYAHDHHHVARFSLGLEKVAGAPEDVKAALRLAYPAVEIDQLRRWGRAYDLDPLLALSIMRQESLYRDTALSHAGAVGLMQVMPQTGAKVADLLDEPDYTPADLEIPAINLRYGVFYLSRLVTRFEGGWPLAVAAYNAGPINVSSWYRQWQGKIGVDDFVEQIPLKETRNYVKRVAEFYGVHVGLYGPEAAVVHVPPKPGDDVREVINF